MEFLLDVLYLLIGAFIIFLGFRAKTRIEVAYGEGGPDSDETLVNNQLIISQMVVGAFICLISGYKLYKKYTD